MERNLLILGAGGHGQFVAEVAASIGCWKRIAFLDDGQTADFILGKCSDFPLFSKDFSDMFPSIGNNQLRYAWIQQLMANGIHIPSLIHPTAYISPSSKLAPGSVIAPKAIVNTHSVIGAGCIIGLGSIIDHDCTIGECCHINSGSIVQAGCHVPALTRLDSGYVFTKEGIR